MFLLDEGGLVLGPVPSTARFPLLRFLVVAFGETQLFSVNISGRLDSYMMGRLVILQSISISFSVFPSKSSIHM